jgi:hypothetical protein
MITDFSLMMLPKSECLISLASACEEASSRASQPLKIGRGVWAPQPTLIQRYPLPAAIRRTAAATAATAAVTTTTSAARLLGASLVDRQRPAVLFAIIQTLDRLTGRVVIAHFNETKPFAAAGVAILNDFRTSHIAVLGEHFFKLRVINAVAQITDIKLLTHNQLQQTVHAQDRVDPNKTSWVEAKGTNVVIHQVARRKRKKQPIRKKRVPRSSRLTNSSHYTTIEAVPLAFSAIIMGRQLASVLYLAEMYGYPVNPSHGKRS